MKDGANSFDRANEKAHGQRTNENRPEQTSTQWPDIKLCEIGCETSYGGNKKRPGEQAFHAP
ncbi:MAG: hypothetical protein WBX22_12810 [Silvibacterium sp.]